MFKLSQSHFAGNLPQDYRFLAERLPNGNFG